MSARPDPSTPFAYRIGWYAAYYGIPVLTGAGLAALILWRTA